MVNPMDVAGEGVVNPTDVAGGQSWIDHWPHP